MQGQDPHKTLKGNEMEKCGLLILICILLLISIKQNESILALQTTQDSIVQDIVKLQQKVKAYPLDHTRIDSNVELIGGKVFTNWNMASELYAKRRK